MKTRWPFISALALFACGLMFVTIGRPTAVAASQDPAAVQENSLEHPYTLKDPGPWGEAKAEVHNPAITYERSGTGLKVTIQVDNHPMDPKMPHYIMWIQLFDGSGKKLGEKTFKDTDPAPAKATFDLAAVPETLKAYERCNIHGIWLNEVEVK